MNEYELFYCSTSRSIRKTRLLKVPCFYIENKVKCITELSSKFMYKLIPSTNLYTNTCCLYWESRLNFEINWLDVFNRNLMHIKDLNCVNLTSNYCIIYCLYEETFTNGAYVMKALVQIVT